MGKSNCENTDTEKELVAQGLCYLNTFKGEGKNMERDGLTDRIIGAAFAVSNTLGSGFLEKVYENALAHELRKCGLRANQQKPVEVYYDDIKVGSYAADMVVEDEVIVELKAVTAFDSIHYAQLLNYLKATGLRTGLLLNFGTPKLGIKRVVL